MYPPTAFQGHAGSEPVFSQAVSLTLGYVSPSDVLVQGAVAVLRRLLRNTIEVGAVGAVGAVSTGTRRYLQQSGAESNVTAVSYTLLATMEEMGFNDPQEAFDDVLAQLEGAVASGECSRNIHDRAAVLDVEVLLAVTCGAVTAVLSGIDDSGGGGGGGSGMSKRDLTIVVVSYTVVFVAICIVCMCSYWGWYRWLLPHRRVRRVIIPKTTIKDKGIADELAVLNRVHEERDGADTDINSVFSGGGTHVQGEAKSDVGDACVDWESNPLGRDNDISSVYSGFEGGGTHTQGEAKSDVEVAWESNPMSSSRNPVVYI
ncbi:hypothetical protein B484DRAFT_200540 [Ochromonadaceae sp. CCMP2298]|nr:hypothetical protein B484DRAFT_200540 [Ochromonadaceae sp. CCMP2298]